MKSVASFHKIFILILVPMLLYLGLLPIMPLMEPDESRYALIPRAMNLSGDYVTPYLAGVVYLEKPPLAYWFTAMAFKAFGENEFAARLFAALCAWGCIMLTYFMGRYFHDRKTGLYSAAILTTCLLPFALGRINILDMPLTFFLTLSLWSGFRCFSDKRKGHRAWMHLCYLGVALAFLTKGLIGLVFPFAIIGLWLIWLRRWRDVLRLISPVGILIFLAMAGPWIYLVHRANPDFLYFFFFQEHILRYTTTMHERTEPFYYYILILLGGAMPWWPYLPKALYGIRKGIKLLAARTMFHREEIGFILAWIGIVFLFFSASSSKLASYIAPVFPPLAVIMGHIFRNYEERSMTNVCLGSKGQIVCNFAIYAQALLFSGILLVPIFIPEYQRIGHPSWIWFACPMIMQVLILFVPEFMKGKIASGWFLSVYFLSAIYLALILFPAGHYLTPGKSAYDVVRAVRTHLPTGEELYQYRISLYGVMFYTNLRTPIVDDIGELKFGVERMNVQDRRYYFLSTEEFIRVVRQGKGKYCITEGMGNVELLKAQIPDAKVLWNNGKFYMLYLKGTS